MGSLSSAGAVAVGAAASAISLLLRSSYGSQLASSSVTVN
jgi:hypothetical protein